MKFRSSYLFLITNATVSAIAAMENVPKSKGCGTPSTIDSKYSPGDSWSDDQIYGGQKLPALYKIPTGYNIEANDTPVPLVLYFHGYGGSPNEGKGLFNDLANANNANGIMSVGLSGIGGSWNGFGSTDSPNGQFGRTCNDKLYGSFCYDDCGGGCTDDCWWTTCQDSVEQAKRLLEQILNEFCIDLSRVFVAGNSNGGMFTHELANDERTAPYLAGILPTVGLPHYGYNKGPAPTTTFNDDGTVEQISYFGMWGAKDTVVPPVQNQADDGTILECRSSEKQGWFYTTADCVTEYWAKQLNCNEERESIAPFHPKINSCWTYKNCNSNKNGNSGKSNVEVTGCIADTNHYSKVNFLNDYIIDFIYSHPKMGLPSNDNDNDDNDDPAPPVVCIANKKKKCNAITGCSWTNANGNKTCKEALSAESCGGFSKRKKCKKIGCVWDRKTKKCKGRW